MGVLSTEEELKAQAAAKRRRLIIRLLIIAAAVIALVLGVIRQRRLHSDEYIKGFIEGNKAAYAACAEVLLAKPTSAPDSDEKLENRITAEHKYGLQSLCSNPLYREDTDKLNAVEKLGTSEVWSDGASVKFYQSVRFVVIFSPSGVGTEGAKSAGEGWYYLNSY